MCMWSVSCLFLGDKKWSEKSENHLISLSLVVCSFITHIYARKWIVSISVQFRRQLIIYSERKKTFFSLCVSSERPFEGHAVIYYVVRRCRRWRYFFQFRRGANRAQKGKRNAYLPICVDGILLTLTTQTQSPSPSHTKWVDGERRKTNSVGQFFCLRGNYQFHRMKFIINVILKERMFHFYSFIMRAKSPESASENFPKNI